MSAGKGGGPAIGIDLGTTYPCVGVWQYDGKTLSEYGNEAVNTVFDAKRLIGLRFSDSSVQSDMKQLCDRLAVPLAMMERLLAAGVTVIERNEGVSP